MAYYEITSLIILYVFTLYLVYVRIFIYEQSLFNQLPNIIIIIS